jgi:hypothetical protein
MGKVSTLVAFEKDRADGTANLSKKDYDYILKHFKKSEQLQLTLDDDQKEQLGKDIQALKGYEMLFVLNNNQEPEEGKNIIHTMINQTFSPDYQIRIYGKVKGDIVNDVLVRLDMWGKVVLSHNDSKVKKDFLMKGLYSGDMVNVEENEDVVDIKDAVKEVKNGSALIVINGEEHPELHSEKDAIEYMRAHNISWNNESWVVGFKQQFMPHYKLLYRVAYHLTG